MFDRYHDSPAPLDTKINQITKLEGTIKRSLSRGILVDFRVQWCRRVTISAEVDEIMSGNIPRHHETVAMVQIVTNLLKPENGEMLTKSTSQQGKTSPPKI